MRTVRGALPSHAKNVNGYRIFPSSSQVLPYPRQTRINPHPLPSAYLTFFDEGPTNPFYPRRWSLNVLHHHAVRRCLIPSPNESVFRAHTMSGCHFQGRVQRALRILKGCINHKAENSAFSFCPSKSAPRVRRRAKKKKIFDAFEPLNRILVLQQKCRRSTGGHVQSDGACQTPL